VAARSRELEREGKRPFTHYFLPEAILRLKQGFGRLVRRGDDRGRVVFLDRRILTKPYGRLFLRALPRCPVVIHEGEGEPRRVEVEE
jgi:Rad3-related DNA helicase